MQSAPIMNGFADGGRAVLAAEWWCHWRLGYRWRERWIRRVCGDASERIY